MINVIASRYAEALFQVGEEEKLTDKLYTELSEIVNLFESNSELFSILKSPVISKNEKISIIENIFENKININVKNFLKILVEKNRISFVKDIASSYKELLNEKNNVLEGVAITAIQMSKEEIKKLEEKLSQKYNKNVTLENQVDKSILGGVLVRLGNEEIDGTVKTRLNKVKEQLSQVIS
ncbi:MULTISPECIES: F0F1 ATP synthase subunit delta [unclassified Romboutsia]|uniref:F0F1 ATP synthase subunit delta n=1 Tax=unclassified Romboutsia TaxID=2626894 RepID=UPI0008220335|nr:MULTISPECIES: F0F1 ATP synthase subunit delta [unclassified Romboutsia]SCI36987.1 F-type ATPase subunit delta [uncultured Clostridium sp.]